MTMKNSEILNDISQTEPTDSASLTIDISMFPPVPEEYRPRDLIFDTLTTEDIAALQKNGYAPILLRWLPRRTEAEDGLWLARLMQGVTEGTVVLDRPRGVALELELKVRKVLYEKGGKLKQEEKKIATSPLDDLNWTPSRHVFAGNTTLVEPEKIAAFVKGVVDAQKEGTSNEASTRGQGAARRTRKR